MGPNSFNFQKGEQIFERSQSLESLATKHGTDKWNCHWYAKHYDHHFLHLRSSQVRLLEIGIGGYKDPSKGGESLRMWKEYFSSGTIVGIDIYDKRPLMEDRIEVFQGSQDDIKFLMNIIASQGPFDIIIDDGSHLCRHVIKSFEFLFVHGLKDTGIYVVEDLQTSYWKAFGGSANLFNPNTSMNFFKRLCDKINWSEWHKPGYTPDYLDLHISGMHFYQNLVFIDKGDNRHGSNIVENNIVPLGLRHPMQARALAGVRRSLKLVAEITDKLKPSKGVKNLD